MGKDQQQTTTTSSSSSLAQMYLLCNRQMTPCMMVTVEAQTAALSAEMQQSSHRLVGVLCQALVAGKLLCCPLCLL